jgi:hypothetical protein
MALRVADVDLATGVINVRRGWDHIEGEIELKSNAGPSQGASARSAP